MFENYLENSELDLREDDGDQNRNLVEALTALIRELRHQRKTFKQLKRCIKERASVREDGESGKEDKRTGDKKESKVKREKPFIEKIGDAFLKALPSILRTVATVVISLVFGRKTGWFKAWRGEVA